MVNQEEYKRRYKKCSECMGKRIVICKKCKCFMLLKCWFRLAECDEWSKRDMSEMQQDRTT